jgi:cytochrome c oxidase cbb3-type subunit 3
MGTIERDPHTGHGTTGHEWNGIKELNTAVPWPIWAFLILAAGFALIWWILMPAWPLGTTYTKGLIGSDVHEVVSASLKTAAEERAAWTNLIDEKDYAAIQADDALMKDVRATGHALFGDNCAACHGSAAMGGPGYPNLTDHDWLWGGKPEEVFETIRVGVNSENPDSRTSQMPAWGEALDRPSLLAVVNYVFSLSHPDAGADAGQLEAGKAVFAKNCAACHGAEAKGNAEIGAPNLTDAVWLYGGDLSSIYATVHGGREGHMPTWQSRLTDTERKILTLYVLDLGKSAP